MQVVRNKIVKKILFNLYDLSAIINNTNILSRHLQ